MGRGTDPRIRIRTKMSRIRNIAGSIVQIRCFKLFISGSGTTRSSEINGQFGGGGEANSSPGVRIAQLRVILIDRPSVSAAAATPCQSCPARCNNIVMLLMPRLLHLLLLLMLRRRWQRFCLKLLRRQQQLRSTNQLFSHLVTTAVAGRRPFAKGGRDRHFVVATTGGRLSRRFGRRFAAGFLQRHRRRFRLGRREIIHAAGIVAIGLDGGGGCDWSSRLPVLLPIGWREHGGGDIVFVELMHGGAQAQL